jgi:hypothetical protein
MGPLAGMVGGAPEASMAWQAASTSVAVQLKMQVAWAVAGRTVALAIAASLVAIKKFRILNPK